MLDEVLAKKITESELEAFNNEVAK